MLPKHFGFVCRPGHATWWNAVRERAFTVSWPGPRHIVMASAAASPRCEDGEKRAMHALPIVGATSVAGVLLDGGRFHLECRVDRVVDDLGEEGVILGRIVAAHGCSESVSGSRRHGACYVGSMERIASQPRSGGQQIITLFLCGDVMTGRGVDQILPHPGSPELYEPVVDSAQKYVELAEKQTGSIPRRVDLAYIWGDTLPELARANADVRIINLETAVTTSAAPWPRKGIHYRMHPANVPCLTAARVDCCMLANNHVLDWGRAGLAQTLDTLHQAGIRTAGAGRDAAEAWAPAVLDTAHAGRVLVFGFGERSSGIPGEWSASADRSGVALVDDLSERTADAITARIGAAKRTGDVAVASIHWGANWGFEVSPQQRAFARRIVDAGSVDVVHGHSSHHIKGIEVYRDRPILYGCGDYLNDYEGIGGYDEFRGDLGSMYFPQLDAATRRLVRFALTPTRIRRLRVERAPEDAQRWIAEVLNREGRRLGGTRAERQPDGTLLLRWNGCA